MRLLRGFMKWLYSITYDMTTDCPYHASPFAKVYGCKCRDNDFIYVNCPMHRNWKSRRVI